jgi:hypothetical protein
MSYENLIEKQYRLRIKLQELSIRFLETQIRERELMLEAYAQQLELNKRKLNSLKLDSLLPYVVINENSSVN